MIISRTFECRTLAQLAASIGITMLLAACGGGGDSQSTSPTSSTSAPYVPPPPPLHQPWETVMMSVRPQTPPYLTQMLQARTCYITWHETPCLAVDDVYYVDFWLKTDYQSLADERLVGSEIYSKIDFVVGGALDYRELSFSLLFNKPTDLIASPIAGTTQWRFENLYRQDVSFCCETSWPGTGYNPNRRSNHVKVGKAMDSPNTIEIELTVMTQDGIYSRQYFFIYGDFFLE